MHACVYVSIYVWGGQGCTGVHAHHSCRTLGLLGNGLDSTERPGRPYVTRAMLGNKTAGPRESTLFSVMRSSGGGTRSLHCGLGAVAFRPLPATSTEDSSLACAGGWLMSTL